MREILYRGFHPCEEGSQKVFVNGKWIRGEWVYGFLFHCSVSNRAKIAEKYAETNLCYLKDVIPEIVCEYTGLTDKNGKKIFEGDVVQTAKYGKDSGTGCNFAGKDTFLVCFEDCGFCLQNKLRRFNLRADTDYETIGNIHDNPELMEDGNV